MTEQQYITSEERARQRVFLKRMVDHWRLGRAAPIEEQTADMLARLVERDEVAVAVPESLGVRCLVLIEGLVAAESYWRTYRHGYRTPDPEEMRDEAIGHLNMAAKHARGIPITMFLALMWFARHIWWQAWHAKITKAFEPRQDTEVSARAAAVGKIKEIVELVYGEPHTAIVRALAEAVLNIAPGTLTEKMIRGAPIPDELAESAGLRVERFPD
jgi:hypothetical protein